MREEIDTCKWLREIGEPVDNSLRLVIEEAKADGPPEDRELLPGKIVSGLRSIESDRACRLFEIVAVLRSEFGSGRAVHSDRQ